MPETLLHVAGLILARGGSQGIPLKNITPLANQPLLVWSLGAMKAFGRFDSVWVSTDHPLIAQCASQMGASVFHRSPKFAKCGSPSVDAVQEFLSAHPEVDIVGLVQCTSPFLQPEFLQKAYELMIEQGYDSVFSVTRDKKLRWSEADFNGDEDDMTDANENSEHKLIMEPLNLANKQIDTSNPVQNDSSNKEELEIVIANSNCDKSSCCCFIHHSIIASPLLVSTVRSESKTNQVNIEQDLKLETNGESYSQEATIQIKDDGNKETVKANKETKSDLDPTSFQIIQLVNSSIVENKMEIPNEDHSNKNGCYKNNIDSNVVGSSIKSDMNNERESVMKLNTNKITTITEKNVSCCGSR